jgi:hypothetical protein
MISSLSSLSGDRPPPHKKPKTAGEKEKEKAVKPYVSYSAPKPHDKKDENRANKTESSFHRMLERGREFSTEKENENEKEKEKENIFNPPVIVSSASKKRKLAVEAPAIASPSMISSLSSLSGDRPPPQKKTQTALEKFHERWMDEREKEKELEKGKVSRYSQWGRTTWTKDEDRA